MVECADDGAQVERELGSVLIGEMEIFPPAGLDDQWALTGALDLSDGTRDDDSDLSWPATPVGPGRAFGDVRQDQPGNAGWLQISLSDEGDVGGQTSFPHPEVDSHALAPPCSCRESIQMLRVGTAVATTSLCAPIPQRLRWPFARASNVL